MVNKNVKKMARKLGEENNPSRVVGGID